MKGLMHMEQLAVEEKRMRGQETELLMQFVSEQGTRLTSILGVTLTPADKIANAVINIAALYSEAIKKLHSGWLDLWHAYIPCSYRTI